METLTEGLAAATLDSGQLLSPRRCSPTRLRRTNHTPIVLGGPSQVLDVGEARRLYAGPQRVAIEIRDRGCTWPGCSRPLGWCEIHHILPWLDDGLTNRDNAALLCTSHHRESEKGDWEMFIRGDRAWYRPPARIDPIPGADPQPQPPPSAGLGASKMDRALPGNDFPSGMQASGLRLASCEHERMEPALQLRG